MDKEEMDSWMGQNFAEWPYELHNSQTILVDKM